MELVRRQSTAVRCRPPCVPLAVRHRTRHRRGGRQRAAGKRGGDRRLTVAGERERERAWKRQTDLVKRDLVKRGEVDGDERRWANDSVEERGRNRRSGGEETRRDKERGGRKEERIGGQGGVLSEFCTWGYLGLDTHCGLKYLRQMASDFKKPIRSILHWEVSFL